ncbi:MAG: bifunctional 4-hydroxy-3-methylbut-2-enyl diphosphate reductase/30S ribosomal protein S1, partial [Oscillospiraceae bacterium]|nr:bifunctional 4-hydroxy-3-methylbut-2-enyl diphosphate reductase/30S ribosomal protein S1 [Oscillospiraceae bacterium]
MIETVPSAGFCYGVARAVRLAAEAAPCYTLGPLIHNKRAVAELAQKDVRVIQTLDELPEGATLVIRSHGAPPELYQTLEERGVRFVDATCRDVKRIHDLVTAEGDRTILLLGDRAHPEIRATAAWCRTCLVFSGLEELRYLVNNGKIDTGLPLTLAAQTTSRRAVWDECRFFLKKQCTNLKILDTICRTTDMRQRDTAALSRRVDVMVVVGDSASANTRHLASVCECPVVFTEGGSRVPRAAGQTRIGITAGASTPSAIIEEVVFAMTEEMNKTLETQGSEDVSFEELFESTLRPLHTGDKVSGVITGISPTDIQVDLGSKHAAYIPLDELSYDAGVDVAALYKVGDEIETYVMRVNDVEGTVMLSKRRLDTVKSWEDVEAAQDTRAVLEGTVVEENKGGVVVSVKGVRVFIPASQTGLPKDAPMSDLLKQKVRLRITEFQRSRRRVVGSIRSVSQEERRARSEEIWNNAEPGKEYNGVVKSLTSYGAFVDIGGVDGLVHLSELSWKRLKAPSDMLKVGDPLTVTVISVDKENRRISLRHRKPEDDPWLKFNSTYRKGDVVSVTVNKLMQFGAFAEVMPGVDGLIHISQLADHRVTKPSDVVSEGDTLDVMITDIDQSRKKISLSVRALNVKEPEETDAGPDEIVAIASGTETL